MAKCNIVFITLSVEITDALCNDFITVHGVLLQTKRWHGRSSVIQIKREQIPKNRQDFNLNSKSEIKRAKQRLTCTSTANRQRRRKCSGSYI